MLEAMSNIALWIDGNFEANLDVWFLPGFAESHLCFKQVYNSEVVNIARAIVFDPPGFGASPARAEGISISECAQIWSELISKVSASRRVILVAHSVSGITAVETAKLLETPPELLVSIEGNLTEVDAYFSGQALNYSDPQMFVDSFSKNVLDLVMDGKVPMSYYSSLQFADSRTLWKMGQSTQKYKTPGLDLLQLKCPVKYYWSEESLSKESKAFLLRYNIENFQFQGLGHWPMLASPITFYKQLSEDILSQVSK